MCFVKKAATVIEEEEIQQKDPVIRQQADATLTKNSQNNTKRSGYTQNVKTTPLGLEDISNNNKKTLLGE